MTPKNDYKLALTALGHLLKTMPHTEGAPDYSELLENIHRYTGELRRKVAALHEQVETDKRQIVSLQLLPAKLATLEHSQAELEHVRRQLQQSEQQRLTLQQLNAKLEKIFRGQPKLSDVDVFTWVKAKCLACCLHFQVATEYPDNHGVTTLYCPECGQHGDGFIVWKDAAKGFIFQHIPGGSPPAEMSHPTNRPRISDIIAPSDN